MKVPPASTYRSRIANAVASSVAVPKCIVPRLSTLTSRRVFGSVPIVRYFMRGSPLRPPDSARALSTSLDARALSRSNRAGPGSRSRLGTSQGVLADGQGGGAVLRAEHRDGEPAGAGAPRRELHLGREAQLGDQAVAAGGPAEADQGIAAEPGPRHGHQASAGHGHQRQLHRLSAV